ncbi:MAG: tetratricopeptide repeat protein, partial [Anaerolineae bacterium]|nr:tetratricopeptide repeat protein [Anaerolineae bacterium]
DVYKRQVDGRDIAYFYRGLIGLQQGQIDSATKDLEAAAALKPDAADIRYLLAVAYGQGCDANARAKRAVIEVSEALRLDPTSIKGYLLLGDLYLEEGQAAKALEAYLKAEAQLNSPAQNAQRQQVTVYDRLYTVYTRLNRPADAQTALSKAVGLRKDEATQAAQGGNELQARVSQAYALLNDSQYDAAVTAFGQALAISPTHSIALRGLATTHLYQSKYAEAEAVLGKALQSNDKDALAYKLLGIVHYSNKKVNESVQALQKATDINSCDPNGLSLLGSAYYVQKNFVAAAKAQQKAAEIQGNDWLFWQAAGGAWLAACGDAAKVCAEHEQALKALSRAAELAPNEFAPAFSLGFVYEQQGKWAEMATQYARALDKTSDPTYREQISRGLGWAYLQQQQYEKAAEAYRAAIALKDQPDSRRGLLQALFAQGKSDDSIAEAQRLLALDPKDAVAIIGARSAYWQRANGLTRQFKFEAAANDFQASLAIQPTPEAYFGAALADYLRCMPDKALGFAQAAAEREAAYQPLYGLMLAATGQTAALERVQASFAAAPIGKVNEHLSYAEYLFLRGEWDKTASEILQLVPEIKQASDMARAQLLLGRAYLQKGNGAAAQQAFAQAVKAQPNHAYAQLYMGSLTLTQNKPSEALAAFDAAQTKLAAYAEADWLNAAILEIDLPLHRSVALKRLGQAGEAQRALDDARARADRLLKLAPSLPSALFASGVVWGELGDAPKAEAAFVAAARCDASLPTLRKRSAEYWQLMK